MPLAEERSLGARLFRLIPALLVVCLVAWCTHQRQTYSPATGQVLTELAELFATHGLIDGPLPSDGLGPAAKRAGPSGMNRLLYASASEASLPALRWIVEHGADPRDVGALEGLPLLHKIAKRPLYDRIEYFLKLGLDPRERSADGQSLMHVAAAGGFDERVLALLVSRGLTVSDATRTGRQPIHFASVKSIAVLANAGADLAAQDNDGRTALHWAVADGRADVATELLRQNASVFVADRQGRTPLHLAALQRSEPIIDALLAAGAPRAARDLDGRTPRELAESARSSRQRQDRERVMDKL